ncbi:MAG: M48 family metalloprotease [Saprospiraceae bacterium]
MTHNSYPPSPSIQDFTFLNPSKSFLNQAAMVMAAILLFAVVYLLLIAGGVLLVYLCGWFSIAMLSVSINKITIALAIGLLGLSLMFFAFLFKFIFAFKKFDTSGSQEIKRDEHPRLFAFIDRLTDELKAPKPKKIYLLPDVNASVFYNSSFWSMFLPVRKNLNIGLGLVNCLNMSEFKAVLAHEFGHFSQRSMKLGSYVYTVNHVIFDLVNNYDKWDRTLEGWANSDSFLSIFARITYWLANQVRSLLRFMYGIINKRNMALSREMEYNADLVAVSAAGCEAMISGLRRVDFGSGAYQTTVDYLNRALGENRIPDNFYTLHKSVLQRMALENDIPVVEELPLITGEHLSRVKPASRVVFQNQWASHPEQEDREANIRKVDLKTEISHASPWQLFENPEKVQAEMTQFMYANVTMPEGKQPLGKAELLAMYEQDLENNKLPEKYNGFYDGRLFMDFDIENALAEQQELPAFELIFSNQNKQNIAAYFSNIQDIHVMKAIKEGTIDVESFDFDGVKYNKLYAGSVLDKLGKEIEAQRQWFKDVEATAFRFHYRQGEKVGKGEELCRKYEAAMLLANEREQYQPFATEANQYLQVLQRKPSWTNEEAVHFMSLVKTLCHKLDHTLNQSEKKALPAPVGGIDAGAPISQYLTEGKKPQFNDHSFDFENFASFYGQVQGIVGKANQLTLDAYKEVVRFQAGL